MEKLVGMNAIAFQAFALSAIEAALKGQPTEDMRVELKSDWLAPSDTARHLAGLCNAALGTPIIWITGVNEKSRAISTPREIEVADWWAQVKAQFAGEAPAMLLHCNLDVGGGRVVAMLFATELAPYLVRVPGGGKVELEVPWREGISTRTARREQLIQILAPWTKQPSLEFVTATLKLESRPERNSSACKSQWTLYAHFYVTQPQGQLAAFAYHKSEVIISDDEQQLATLEKINFREMPSGIPGGLPALSLVGPGYVRVTASLVFRRNHPLGFPGDKLLIGFIASLANIDRDVEVVCEVTAPGRYHGQPRLEVDVYNKEWHYPPEVPKIEMPRRSLSELHARAQQRRPH